MSARNGLFYGIPAPRRPADFTDAERNAALNTLKMYGALDASQLGVYARLDEDKTLAVLNDLLIEGDVIIFEIPKGEKNPSRFVYAFYSLIFMLLFPTDLTEHILVLMQKVYMGHQTLEALDSRQEVLGRMLAAI